MVPGELEMVKQVVDNAAAREKFTSLQPTYEDSIPPEDEWEYEGD